MKEVKSKTEEKFANERAVFDKLVKANRGTVHKVVAQGVTIEMTDRKNSAAEAYKNAQKPKQWFAIQTSGAIEVIGNEI